ncbi:hypothetical protein [Melghirimyces algeriensis]|uniref:Uncharacterized protein n=1 Tax=Melghirimyces algeriensis TaxID=910412 RepID=A0A521EJ84_9BACL|nr:hypothetical protein [Melghirimyces algeriensis]SMO83988.1 hypothetical protein SAMN06264849_109106 [Melghirimyces algeriensis]
MKIKFALTHWLVAGSAVALFILDLWIENGSGTVYSNYYLEDILGYRFPLIVTFLLLIFCILIARMRGEVYKDILADKARTFMELYDHLNEMQWRSSIEKAMEKFARNEPHVLASQLYKYNMKHYHRHVKVQVNHITAYVSEGFELNALVQIIFDIDKDLYYRFLRAKRDIDKNKPDSLLSLIGEIYHEIKEYGNRDQVNDNLSLKYAFLVMGINLLENKLNIEVSFPLDEDLIMALNEQKRTGILRGILLDEEVYIFEHKGTSRKRGRLYLTRTTEIKGTPYIFMLTLNPDILYEDDEYNELDRIQQKFAKHMQSTFHLPYNDPID